MSKNIKVSDLKIIAPPRLLITNERLRQIREHPDEVQQEMLEAIRGRPLNDPPTPIQTMIHDAMLWLLFDDAEAAQRAAETVRSVMQSEDSSVIGDGLGTMRIGIAFDLLNGFLSGPGQATVRQEIVDGIAGCTKRHKTWFDKKWEEVYHGRVSLDNHINRGVFALISVGLALLEEVPEAKSWLEQGISFLQRTLRAYPPDGSDIYAGTWFTLHYSSELIPMIFLRNAGLNLFHGQTALINHVRFRQFCAVGEMLDHIAFNGDSHAHKVAGDSYLLYILASAYRDQHAQWFGHKLRVLSRDPSGIRGALPLYDSPPVEAFDLACYDPTVPVQCELANWPTAAYFPDTGQAILRGGWGPDAPVLWFCCAPVGGNYRDPDVSPIRWHAQPMAGAFEVFSGRAFVTEEPNPSTTRRTYVGNTITVNGIGQEGEEAEREIRIAMLEPGELGTADIRRFHHGPGYDLVQGEAWRAYRAEAGLTGFTRTIVFIRPDFFVVYDSLQAQAPSRFEWRLHTAGEIVPLERQDSVPRFLFRHEGGALSVDMAFPSEAIAEGTPSAYSPGYSSSFKRYRHLLVTPRKPVGSTAFLSLLHPVGCYGSVENHRIHRVEGSGVQGIVLEYGAGREVVLFAQEMGQLSLKGIEMDGEGCAVGLSYQNNPHRFLLWGGRELRYNDILLFQSDQPVDTASFRIERSECWGIVRLNDPTTLKLAIPEKAELRIDGETTVPLAQDSGVAEFKMQPGEHKIRASGPPQKQHAKKTMITTSVWPSQGPVFLDVDSNTFCEGQEILVSTSCGSELGWRPKYQTQFGPNKNSFEVTRVRKVISPTKLELSDGLLFYPNYTMENGVYITGDNLMPDGDMADKDMLNWLVFGEPNVAVEKVSGRSPLGDLCLRVHTRTVEEWEVHGIFPVSPDESLEGRVGQEIFGLEPEGTYRLTFSTYLVKGSGIVEYHDAGNPTRVSPLIGDWFHHTAEFRFMIHEDDTPWVGAGRAKDTFFFQCRLRPDSEMLLDGVSLQRR